MLISGRPGKLPLFLQSLYLLVLIAETMTGGIKVLSEFSVRMVLNVFFKIGVIKTFFQEEKE